MTRRWRLLIAALAGAVLLAGCGQSTAPSPPAGSSTSGTGGAVAVVASTNVWADIASAVGGDAVTVTAIIADPAGDPHSYQASAKDAAVLMGAELVVSNGGGYDPFVDQILGGEGPRRVVAVGAAARQDTGNEHVWYDLPTVARVADAIATQLGEIRPAARATFAANAGLLRSRITGLQQQVAQIAARHAGTPIAVTEPVAHYLLDAAKLTDQTPPEFVYAIEAETDPSAGAVAAAQQLISDHRVALLVHNPQTETPVVADLLRLARQASVPVVDMTETLPSGLDYVTWMRNQITALSDALTR